jgi:hypothetical protein
LLDQSLSTTQDDSLLLAGADAGFLTGKSILLAGGQVLR